MGPRATLELQEYAKQLLGDSAVFCELCKLLVIQVRLILHSLVGLPFLLLILPPPR